MCRESQTALAAVALGAVEPTGMVMDAAQYSCASTFIAVLWCWCIRDGTQERASDP